MSDSDSNVKNVQGLFLVCTYNFQSREDMLGSPMGTFGGAWGSWHGLSTYIFYTCKNKQGKMKYLVFVSTTGNKHKN